MEDKERYVFKGLLDDEVVIDNETNEELSCLCELVSRLNLQDKRIKELEEENNFLEKRNEKLIIDRRDFCLEKNDIFEENQQLKQSQKTTCY